MENNGKGLFYGVIGVATLIVAIIGATFAYFTATANGDANLEGNIANVSGALTVTVQRVSTGANGDLIPLDDTLLSTAVTGYNNTSCLDIDGYTACQVYSVTITNTGTVSTDYTTTMASFTAASASNMKWARISGATNGTVLDAAGANSSVAASSYGTTDTYPVTFDSSTTLGAAGSGSNSATFYIVVWLDDPGSPQPDSGTFTGVITVNSAYGNVTATFTRS